MIAPLRSPEVHGEEDSLTQARRHVAEMLLARSTARRQSWRTLSWKGWALLGWALLVASYYLVQVVR
jgi:hypothetical protein